MDWNRALLYGINYKCERCPISYTFQIQGRTCNEIYGTREKSMDRAGVRFVPMLRSRATKGEISQANTKKQTRWNISQTAIDICF